MVAARFAAVHAEDPAFPDPATAAVSEATEIPGLFDWSTATIEVNYADCDGAGVATSSISVSPGSMSEWFMLGPWKSSLSLVLRGECHAVDERTRRRRHSRVSEALALF